VAWYERFAGRPPDLIPNAKEAAWQLSATGWIYLLADAEHAGSALLTLLVEDLDAFLAGLHERGITASPIELIGDAVRHTVVTDPDGNRLKVGQPPV
jgi:hypothetical protein